MQPGKFGDILVQQTLPGAYFLISISNSAEHNGTLHESHILSNFENYRGGGVAKKIPKPFREPGHCCFLTFLHLSPSFPKDPVEEQPAYRKGKEFWTGSQGC